MECAWAASRTKHTYLKAKYHSLAGKRGKKRALVAIGHKILIMSYHILKDKVSYKELGEEYLNRIKKDKMVKNHIKALKQFGYEVQIKEAVAVAV